MPSLQERMRVVFPNPGERGLQVEISKTCHVSRPTVSNWFNRPDKVSTISRNHAELICAKYRPDISPAWLSDGTRPMLIADVAHRGASEPSNIAEAPALIDSRWIPVVGHVKAGDDGYLDEMQFPVGTGDGYVEYWVRDQAAYAVRVKGDSMHPRYRAGEFIVVTPGIEATPGRDVVVKLRDGRKLLKQFNWMRDGEIQLLSINNGYAPMTIPLEEVDSIQRVAGAVPADAFHNDRSA